MSGILCLKWNNHSSSFTRILDTLRSKELYCDVTLVCRGKYYPVHRFVLSTCSEYFEDVFAHAPCKHPFVILKDTEPHELESILNFMYNGEVNVLQENLQKFINAAEALRVKGLAVPDIDTSENEDTEKNNLSLDFNGTSINPEASVEIDDSEDMREDETSMIPVKTKIAKSEKANSETDINPIDETTNDNSSGVVEEVYVKNEPADQTDPLEMNSGLSDFVSTSKKDSLPYLNENEQTERLSPSALMDNVTPQCSTWENNTLGEAGSFTGEIESSWSQAGIDFESFPLDSLHYLATPDDTALSEKGGSISGDSTKASKLYKHCCSECSFKSNDRAALRVHVMRRHTGERPFSCSFCAYRCTTRDMLKIHVRKHTGEKPFTCPYCSISMSVKSRIKRHILVKHIRPQKPRTPASSDSSIVVDTETPIGVLRSFRCSQCSYESQTRSNLKLHHMRMHTGEKPFACSVCSYRTTTKAQLDKHIRKHTGEKPFACTFCSYRASQKHSLIRHMGIHLK